MIFVNDLSQILEPASIANVLVNLLGLEGCDSDALSMEPFIASIAADKEGVLVLFRIGLATDAVEFAVVGFFAIVGIIRIVFFVFRISLFVVVFVVIIVGFVIRFLLLHLFIALVSVAVDDVCCCSSVGFFDSISVVGMIAAVMFSVQC